MAESLKHLKVGTVVCDQCQYGLQTKSSRAPGMLDPAKKPTKFASNSPQMLARLKKRCPGNHRHQHLTEGRAKNAAYYPTNFVEAILRGIRDTADAEAHQREQQDLLPDDEVDRRQFVQALHAAESMQDLPLPLAVRLKEQDLEKKLDKLRVKFNYANGKSESLKPQWKDSYRDEYTNEVLPKQHMR